MNRLVECLFDFVFGDVFFGEVSEGRMGVFGGVLVFPWFIGFVVLLSKYVFELVFTCVEWGVHWIWDARLSLRSELAIELCCSLGSIDGSYKINLFQKILILLALWLAASKHQDIIFSVTLAPKPPQISNNPDNKYLCSL